MKTPPEDQSGTESAKETNKVSKEGWIGNKSALTGTDWGLESGPPTDSKRLKKNWSNWKTSGVWEAWKPDMVPRCAEFNRRTWLPQQEPEWNNEWRRERSHTPGGTSNCPQNKDSDDELGGIDSTDHEEDQE